MAVMPTMSAPAASNPASSAFAQQLNGNFKGMLRWPQLDALWQQVRAEPNGWYASQLNQPVPEQPMDADALNRFVDEVDALLRREHQQDYCGIVFADQAERPAFIKIYDPNNLGSACNTSGTPIAPLWVLSRVKPEHLADSAPQPSSRRNWWNKLFG